MENFKENLIALEDNDSLSRENITDDMVISPTGRGDTVIERQSKKQREIQEQQEQNRRIVERVLEDNKTYTGEQILDQLIKEYDLEDDKENGTVYVPEHVRKIL